MGVVGRVNLLKLDVSEVSVLLPHDDPLVLHRVWYCKCLENPWLCTDHAILVGLYAVFSCNFSICFGDKKGESLLCVVFLSFLS